MVSSSCKLRWLSNIRCFGGIAKVTMTVEGVPLGIVLDAVAEVEADLPACPMRVGGKAVESDGFAAPDRAGVFFALSANDADINQHQKSCWGWMPMVGNGNLSHRCQLGLC